MDFQITAVADLPRPGLHAVQGKVTVERKSNGLRMSYPARHGRSSWVVAFESDLREGKFGPA